MYMYVKLKCTFENLLNNVSSNAAFILKLIEDFDLTTEFMNYIEEYFDGEIPTEERINDFIIERDDWLEDNLDADDILDFETLKYFCDNCGYSSLLETLEKIQEADKVNEYEELLKNENFDKDVKIVIYIENDFDIEDFLEEN